MADPTDLDDLARRFLDLWQQQVQAAVSDPALAEWLAQLTAAPGVAAATPDADRRPKDNVDGQSDSDTPRGTAAPAAPSRAGDPSMDEFARRLAACEERLAALESALDAGGGKAPARSRRRRG